MISKKIISGIMASLLSVVMLVGCAADNETPETPAETPEETPMESEEGLELTIVELAEYDGMNGNKAYIAIDGNVYDVTDVAPWAGGMHNSFPAGMDYTKEIKEVSPHGLSPLENLEPIGTIVD